MMKKIVDIDGNAHYINMYRIMSLSRTQIKSPNGDMKEGVKVIFSVQEWITVAGDVDSVHKQLFWGEE